MDFFEMEECVKDSPEIKIAKNLFVFGRVLVGLSYLSKNLKNGATPFLPAAKF